MDMKKTLSEFKEFAIKGNVVDMAVGVIIGGAFGKIVSSLVDDIIMPVVSLLTGGVDFSNLFLAMDGGSYPSLEAAKAAGAATISYGIFLSQVLDFLIVAFTIFIVIKQLARLKKTAPPVEPSTRKCPFCLSAIEKEATRCPHCTSVVEAEN